MGLNGPEQHTKAFFSGLLCLCLLSSCLCRTRLVGKSCTNPSYVILMGSLNVYENASACWKMQLNTNLYIFMSMTSF